VEGEGMWYNRKQTDKVFARQLTKHERIVVSNHSGLDYDGDKNTYYDEGDYIVFEEGKGISFWRAVDFKQEFDTEVSRNLVDTYR
jgi:hypothetical protein